VSARRRLVLFAAAVGALAAISLAHADGEAGLVIQQDDTVIAYCVPFTGDSITGDQLLEHAGLAIERYPASGAQAVCALNDVGCFNPGTFDGCFCQCKSGGGSCTYWAFFTQRYGGSWVYSALAFNLVKARDGDLQGWKWGSGSPSSAPAPAGITFEQVCGHSPRGSTLSTPPPTPTSGGAAPDTAQPSPVPPTAVETAGVTSGPPSPAGSASPGDASPPTSALTVVITAGTTERNTPAAPATGKDDDGGPNVGAIAAFAAVAAGLLAATLALTAWWKRHGR
jgi:hypothetical protein